MRSDTTITGFNSFAESEGDTAQSATDELDKYREELAEFDLTDEQEAELLFILWSIIQNFVELGFTVDVCEQIFGEFNINSAGYAGGDTLPSSSNTENKPRNGKETP